MHVSNADVRLRATSLSAATFVSAYSETGRSSESSVTYALASAIFP